MRSALAACLFPLVLSGPLAATPPDIIDVRDEIFGISAEKILLTRTTSDNLGIHTGEMRLMYLVEIDRQSFAEQIFPIYSFRQTEYYDSVADKAAPEIQAEIPDGAVKPYQRLADLKGRPLVGLDGIRSTAEITRKGTFLEISLPGNEPFSVEVSELWNRMTLSIDQLVEVIPIYPRLAPVTVSDLLAGGDFSQQECEYSDVATYFDNLGPEITMLRVTCDDESQVASLIFAIKR